MKRWIALCAGLLLLAALPFPAFALDEPPPWCISVWYPSAESGGLDSLRTYAEHIDMIHPFWYAQRTDGTIQLAQNAEDPALLAEWREAGMLIVPSIGGSIWEMIAEPDVRDFHIGEIVALVERMDYDGIDIDYEGFPLFTRDDFSIFIESLSAQLRERGKLLTIAVHAKTSDVSAYDAATAQDWARITPAVDVFTIMTYDYTNRNEPPGPIGPPDWILDVLAYAESVTDLRKVRMGLHLYAYSWQRDSPPATTVDWAAAQRLIETWELEIERDPADMEAWITFKARGLPRQTIYFADSVGIEYKLGLIFEAFPALGGAAIWGVGGEDPAAWEVLRSAPQAHCPLQPST